LGEATGAARVYYGQVREEETGAYWRATQLWSAPASESRFDISKLSHLPVSGFPVWVNDLHNQGWAGSNLSSAPDAERHYLETQGIQSSLWVAVSGRTLTPSYIAIEMLDRDQEFKLEEINAYKVVANALSNTFTREGLLEQLQVSLDETENLYNASHKLALATDLNEMLSSITQALVVPALNRGVLLMFERTPAGVLEKIIVAATWYNGRGSPPPEINSEYSVTLFGSFLSRQSPEFFDDINDIQITEPVRNELEKQGVGALAVLPLWVSKRQIGALLLEFSERHHFGSRELRSYPPLVDQMATTVENLRLFRQTQDALAETELLYKISNGVAQANNADDLVKLLTDTVLPQKANFVSLGVVIHDSTGNPAELEILASTKSEEVDLPAGSIIPLNSLPLLLKMQDYPVYITNIEKDVNLDQLSKSTLLNLKATSICLVPLRSAGHLAGILIITSNKESAFSPDEIRLIALAAGGISVAIERQRLLREAQRRALELQTAAEIARDTTSTLAMDQLLKRFATQICDRFNFYHVAIFLIDQTGQNVIFQEGTGDIGTALKSSELKFAVDSNRF